MSRKKCIFVTLAATFLAALVMLAGCGDGDNSSNTDTTLMTDTLLVRDTTVIRDTTQITDTLLVRDTTVIRDTTQITDTLLVRDTTVIRDTTLVIDTLLVKDSTFSLSVGVNPVGSGSVARDPVETSYAVGTQVTVTATANAGYKFVGWSGASTSTNNAVTVTMDRNKMLRANFEAVTYTLTTTVSPNGGGIVTRSPDQASYAPGTQVTLMATAANEYSFAGWTGASSATNAVTVTMNGDLEVTAKFVIGLLFTDSRDGKTYRVVEIGGKIWMAENLNYETADSSWCYNDTSSNCATYGRLYSWNAAMSACPVGWRLPTREDWDTLMTAVGGSATAGTKLKSKSPNWDSTDDYEFSALPGGNRYPDGTFYALGAYGNWWTATEYDASYAYYRDMYSGGTHVSELNNLNKSYGFSVRCLQD